MVILVMVVPVLVSPSPMPSKGMVAVVVLVYLSILYIQEIDLVLRNRPGLVVVGVLVELI